MRDFYSLLKEHVGGADACTADARRLVYERGRCALIASCESGGIESVERDGMLSSFDAAVTRFEAEIRVSREGNTEASEHPRGVDPKAGGAAEESSVHSSLVSIPSQRYVASGKEGAVYGTSSSVPETVAGHGVAAQSRPAFGSAGVVYKPDGFQGFRGVGRVLAHPAKYPASRPGNARTRAKGTGSHTAATSALNLQRTAIPDGTAENRILLMGRNSASLTADRGRLTGSDASSASMRHPGHAGSGRLELLETREAWNLRWILWLSGSVFFVIVLVALYWVFGRASGWLQESPGDNSSPPVVGRGEILQTSERDTGLRISQEERAAPAASMRFLSDGVQDPGTPDTATLAEGGAGHHTQVPPDHVEAVDLLIQDPAVEGEIVRSTGYARWSMIGEAERAQLQIMAVIPERNMQLEMRMRLSNNARNPASHIVELSFRSMDGEPIGDRRVNDVPGVGIWSQELGDEGRLLLALRGVGTSVSAGYYVIGLVGDRERIKSGLGELSKSSEFVIPVQFTDGLSVLFKVSKGETGSRVVSDVFEAWEKG